MPTNAMAITRQPLRLRPVNADDLLDQILARGIAREVTPQPQVSRAIRINLIEFGITSKPTERHMRARWRERVGTKNISYLLIANDPKDHSRVLALGPRTHEEPIRSVECARLANAILAIESKTEFYALRHLAGEVIRLESRGKIFNGLLTEHALETRFREDPTCWEAAKSATTELIIEGHWRTVINGLGYEIERLEPRGYLAHYKDRPVALVHPRANPQGFIRFDEMCRPAEDVLACDCHKHNVRYGILACRNRYRLFDCHPSATTAKWLDLDAELLDEADLPYLALLSPKYLAEGGLLALQADAEAFGAELR